MTPVPVNRVVANMQDLLRHSVGQASGSRRGWAKRRYAVCDVNQLENAI
jgi:hypothetical protein